MGELGALFNPGMRHELEERRAKAARREEEGNARDGDLRIDLESGVAVINAPGEGDDAGSDAPGSAAVDTDSGAASSTFGTPVPEDESAAQGKPRAQDEPTAEGTPVAQEGPATDDEPAKPAPLRPRGKRAMSASRR